MHDVNEQKPAKNRLHGKKKRLLVLPLLLVLLGLIPLGIFLARLDAVVGYLVGAVVVLGTVFLFSLLAEILLMSEASASEKKLFTILAAPLKLALLILPILLFRSYDSSVVIWFFVGFFLALSGFVFSAVRDHEK